LMLNYRRGRVGEIPWTWGWDKYMFLNSTQELELLKVHGGVKTKVLPPCTELEGFLKVNPDYNNSLRVVRHSSQGDVKFPKDIGESISTLIQERPNTSIHMLPGPSFVLFNDPFFKYSRTDNPSVIADFLAKGNVFWYSLPEGYMDMGPRVILEAMAAGLPIVADNWGGAVDRVTPETGWLCGTKQEHLAVLKHLSYEELKQKGEAAKERARSEFVPERWIAEILS